MNSNPGVGLVAALLMLALSAGQGLARDCKSEPVVAEGAPALMKNLGAYQSSLFAWRRAVAEKMGAEFNSWRYADQRTVDCNEVKTNEGLRWVCKRSAVPCKDTLSTVLSGEKLQKMQCKDETVSSYGRREASEAEAVEQAKWAWRLDVRKRFDASWAKWDNASGADHDCRKVDAKWQCISVATPCRDR